MEFNFADYYTEKEGDKTIIRIKYKIPLISKLILTGAWVFILLKLFRIGSEVSQSNKAFFYLVSFGSIFIGIILGLFLIRKINGDRKAKQKIIIDSGNRELLYPFENFSAKLNDIKDVQIQEKVVFLGPKLSQLKLVLSSGEKVIDFPIGNYNKAEEFRKLIKDNL